MHAVIEKQTGKILIQQNVTFEEIVSYSCSKYFLFHSCEMTLQLSD